MMTNLFSRRHALATMGGTTLAAGVSWTVPASSAAPASQVAGTPTIPDPVIDQARNRDPEGYDARYRELATNGCLMSLLTSVLGEAEARRQVGPLAAVVTPGHLAGFKENTLGKRFRTTLVGGEWGLELVSAADAEGLESREGPIALPKCWQAWVAAFAWYVGTGAICGVVSIATFIVALAGGAACVVGLFTSGMVINWNNSCK